MLLSSLAASIYARITFVLGLCAWGIPTAVGFSQMTSCRLQLIIAPWYYPWADNTFRSTVSRTIQLHHQLTAVLAHITYHKELHAEMAAF